MLEESHAFKFADVMGVFFSCQIALCMKAEPDCAAVTVLLRSFRASSGPTHSFLCSRPSARGRPRRWWRANTPTPSRKSRKTLKVPRRCSRGPTKGSTSVQSTQSMRATGRGRRALSPRRSTGMKRAMGMGTKSTISTTPPLPPPRLPTPPQVPRSAVPSRTFFGRLLIVARGQGLKPRV